MHLYARNEVRLATGVCENAARRVAHLLALVFATPSWAREIIEVTSQAHPLRLAQAARARKKRRKIIEKTSQIRPKIVQNQRKIVKNGASGAPGRSGAARGRRRRRPRALRSAPGTPQERSWDGPGCSKTAQEHSSPSIREPKKIHMRTPVCIIF